MPSRRLSSAVDVAYTVSSVTNAKCVSNIGPESVQTLPEVQPPKPSEWKEILLEAQQEPVSPRFVSRCLMLALVYVSIFRWTSALFFL